MGSGALLAMTYDWMGHPYFNYMVFGVVALLGVIIMDFGIQDNLYLPSYFRV